MSVLETNLTRALPTRRAPLVPSFRPFGHLRAIQRDDIGLMMRVFREYGDIARLRMVHREVVFTANPEDVKRVLVDDHGIFSKQTHGYQVLRRFLGQGLVTSEGDFWRRQRRIAQPAFHRKRLATLADSMQRATDATARSWAAYARAGTTVDVAEEMMQLTLRIAGQTLMSYDLSDSSSEVGDAVNDLMHYFSWASKTPFPRADWLPLKIVRRGQKAQEVIDRLVTGMIAQRRAEGGGPLDLLDMFMQARDEDTGEGMSDAQLRDEIVTMLSAGHETTANALAWTFYLLGKHPEARRRAQLEIDQALSLGPLEVPRLRELTYTHQVFQEAMRLFPPVWAIDRRAETDTELSGYHIPKGTSVLMSPYVIHRHPKHWRRPEEFDPDRFAPSATDPNRHRLAYFPFASGPRKCIGAHFTKMEALIILSTLLSRYTPELVPGQLIQPETSVTLRPKRGVKMILTARD